MKRIYLPTLMALIAGCASAPQKNAVENMETSTSSVSTNSAGQKSAYNLGLLHIKTVRDGQYGIDQQAYEQGLRDALAGNTKTGSGTLTEWQALARMNFAQLKAANRHAGEVFMENNKTAKDIVTLPSGVQYQILKQGQGDLPRLKDTVGIMYTISGIDGKVKVDTTVKGKAKMYEVQLQKLVSKGWQEAILLMPKDSKWRIFIPGPLALGEKGLIEKDIMPNEALVIDTYLLEVK